MTYKPPRIVDSAGKAQSRDHNYSMVHDDDLAIEVNWYNATEYHNRMMFKVIAREIRRQRHTTNGYICGNWKTHEDMYGEPTMDQWWYSGVIALNESKHMPDFLPDELATLESKWHPLPHDVKE